MFEMNTSSLMSGEGKPPAASRSRSSALPRLYASQPHLSSIGPISPVHAELWRLRGRGIPVSGALDSKETRLRAGILRSAIWAYPLFNGAPQRRRNSQTSPGLLSQAFRPMPLGTTPFAHAGCLCGCVCSIKGGATHIGALAQSRRPHSSVQGELFLRSSDWQRALSDPTPYTSTTERRHRLKFRKSHWGIMTIKRHCVGTCEKSPGTNSTRKSSG